MLIEELKNRISDMLSFIDFHEQNNKSIQRKNEKLDWANERAFNQFLLINKRALKRVLICLDNNQPDYRCFDFLNPILKNMFPYKKEWGPLFGFLLAKAKRTESDYTIMESYIEKINNAEYVADSDLELGIMRNYYDNVKNNDSYKNTVFLHNIVDDNGDFLPYELTDYDRTLLKVLGMDDEQISIVSRECRSKLRQTKAKQQPTERVIKGTKTVDINKMQQDIKLRKEKLEFLKCFLSLDNYTIIMSREISEEEKENIVITLEELGFADDKIELITNRINKFNEQMRNNVLLAQINDLKQELFTDEMFGSYEAATKTANDASFVYKNLKEDLNRQVAYIDSILVNCINGTETKDDTCEYLSMAFEDLRATLKLCGARLVRN